ncbi:MAG: hypothetical protein NTX59_05420 [Elusimicrobia bacterium]|nr:hypothetical protein [Elusimicrobiota bacterium]
MNSLGVAGKIRLAVLELPGDEIPREAVSQITKFIKNEFAESDRYNVVSAEDIDTVLTDSSINQRACLTPKCISAMGRLLGVQQLLVGTVSKSSETYVISVKLAEAEKGETLASVYLEISSGLPQAYRLFNTREQSAKNTKRTSASVGLITGADVPHEDAGAIGNFIRTMLANSGAYRIIEKGEMLRVLAEKQYHTRLCADTDCAADIGRLLDVRQSAVGIMSKSSDAYHAALVLADVETGKTLASAILNVSCDSGLVCGYPVKIPAETYPVVAELPGSAEAEAVLPLIKPSSGRDTIHIAVADFAGKNVSQADASIVADFLRTEMVGAGGFDVMDRANMETVLAEQKLQSSGCTEQECAVQMGKLLNVQFIAVGSLSKLLDIYFVTVNLIDVETGKITASYDHDASSARELRGACKKLVQKLAGH